jgi:hypothetical protein
MANCIISPCTVADAADLGRNNMSAFWEDPNWVLSWQHTTLEEHIITATKRYPRRLISDLATSRHQKAVDPETGRLLGYARWDLPEAHATTADGEPAWPEAVVPAVGPEEEAEIRRVAAETPFNPNPQGDPMDVKVGKIKREIMGRKPYMCTYESRDTENKGN